MTARRLRHLLLLPALLAGGLLSACASNGVPPGYVTTTGGSAGGGSTAAAPVVGTPTGETGRVVSINDSSVQGVGSGNGPLVGGLLGAGAGAIIGSIVRQGGGLVGALLGVVGGAIVGSIIDGKQGGGRGIEVVVQKDDGQKVTLAQRDDGDIQLGDRVQIVQDSAGVAKAVRATTPPAPEKSTN